MCPRILHVRGDQERLRAIVRQRAAEGERDAGLRPTRKIAGHEHGLHVVGKLRRERAPEFPVGRLGQAAFGPELPSGRHGRHDWSTGEPTQLASTTHPRGKLAEPERREDGEEDRAEERENGVANRAWRARLGGWSRRFRQQKLRPCRRDGDAQLAQLLSDHAPFGGTASQAKGANELRSLACDPLALGGELQREKRAGDGVGDGRGAYGRVAPPFDVDDIRLGIHGRGDLVLE